MKDKEKWKRIIFQATNIVLQGPETGMEPEELTGALGMALAIMTHRMDNSQEFMHKIVDACYLDLKDMMSCMEAEDIVEQLGMSWTKHEGGEPN